MIVCRRFGGHARLAGRRRPNPLNLSDARETARKQNMQATRWRAFVIPNAIAAGALVSSRSQFANEASRKIKTKHSNYKN